MDTTTVERVNAQKRYLNLSSLLANVFGCISICTFRCKKVSGYLKCAKLFCFLVVVIQAFRLHKENKKVRNDLHEEAPRNNRTWTINKYILLVMGQQLCNLVTSLPYCHGAAFFRLKFSFSDVRSILQPKILPNIRKVAESNEELSKYISPISEIEEAVKTVNDNVENMVRHMPHNKLMKRRSSTFRDQIRNGCLKSNLESGKITHNFWFKWFSGKLKKRLDRQESDLNIEISAYNEKMNNILEFAKGCCVEQLPERLQRKLNSLKTIVLHFASSSLLDKWENITTLTKRLQRASQTPEVITCILDKLAIIRDMTVLFNNISEVLRTESDLKAYTSGIKDFNTTTVQLTEQLTDLSPTTSQNIISVAESAIMHLKKADEIQKEITQSIRHTSSWSKPSFRETVDGKWTAIWLDHVKMLQNSFLMFRQKASTVLKGIKVTESLDSQSIEDVKADVTPLQMEH